MCVCMRGGEYKENKQTNKQKWRKLSIGIVKMKNISSLSYYSILSGKLNHPILIGWYCSAKCVWMTFNIQFSNTIEYGCSISIYTSMEYEQHAYISYSEAYLCKYLNQFVQTFLQRVSQCCVSIQLIRHFFIGFAAAVVVGVIAATTTAASAVEIAVLVLAPKINLSQLQM